MTNPKEEPWREHAEQEGQLRVLTWTGIGKSTLVWCPRFGVVYQVGGRAVATVCGQTLSKLVWSVAGLNCEHRDMWELGIHQ